MNPAERWPFATAADMAAYLEFRAAVGRGERTVRNVFFHTFGTPIGTALARFLSEPRTVWEDFHESLRKGEVAGDLPLPVEEWVVKSRGGRIVLVHPELLDGAALGLAARRLLAPEKAEVRKAWWAAWLMVEGDEIAPEDQAGQCIVRLANEPFPASEPGLFKTGAVRHSINKEPHEHDD